MLSWPCSYPLKPLITRPYENANWFYAVFLRACFTHSKEMTVKSIKKVCSFLRDKSKWVSECYFFRIFSLTISSRPEVFSKNATLHRNTYGKALLQQSYNLQSCNIYLVPSPLAKIQILPILAKNAKKYKLNFLFKKFIKNSASSLMLSLQLCKFFQIAK